jgi:hypothetical protein
MNNTLRQAKVIFPRLYGRELRKAWAKYKRIVLRRKILKQQLHNLALLEQRLQRFGAYDGGKVDPLLLLRLKPSEQLKQARAETYQLTRGLVIGTPRQTAQRLRRSKQREYEAQMAIIASPLALPLIDPELITKPRGRAYYTLGQARLRALIAIPDDDDQPVAGSLDWQDVISKW